MSDQKQLALELLGEVFVTGVSGLDLSSSSADFLKSKRIGGVILFGANYENPGQVVELIQEIQECKTDLPLWISVDHEGGRVQRFKKAFSKIPEAKKVGDHDSPKLAFDLATGFANELKAVGVNLNFSPVADVQTNPKNPVIGSRAFGSDDELVSKMVSAYVRGHLIAGVQPCLKHFPGHGDTSVDSHFGLPKVETDLETLEAREFKPFLKGIKAKCPFVMSAHVVMKKIDPSVPATLSPKIITGILREKLGFDGLIITDDMEMKAISDHFGIKDAPRLALEAGCNLIIYRSEASTRLAYDALAEAIETGKLDPKFVIDSATRSRKLKKETLLPYKAIEVLEIMQKLCRPELAALIAEVEPESSPPVNSRSK